MINQILPGIIRTVVPYIVGLVASLFIAAGLELPSEATGDLTALFTFLIGSGYYVLALWLQERFPGNKVLSYLLGSPKTPTYKEDSTER